MKYLLLLLLLTATPAWALDLSRHPVTPYSYSFNKVVKTPRRPAGVLARVTVYWAKEDRYSRRHQSATGARLRAGHCAVDPRRIPYGSKIAMGNEVLTAVDTGSAVRSRRAARLSGHTPAEKAAIVIDRFFETRGQAFAWARQHPMFLTITILPPS